MLTRLGLGVLFVVLAFGVGHADCPDRRASCLLHEEGVALLLEGKHKPAAEKFVAAIATEPSARSYLGHSQAVEKLGQLALAYDSMLQAQRLSEAEVKSNSADTDVKARAERIKYRIGELRAKIGFVWLRVPEGASPQRVIAVQREGEGQLSSPMTQWTAVAPDKQVLIVTVDDGSKLTVVAQVAAGSQGVVVIPIAPSVGSRTPVRTAGAPGAPTAPMPFEPPKRTPIYKRWWFWTLVVVGTLVIISAASSSADSTSGGGFKPSMFDRPVPPPTPSGVTVFRF